MSSAIFVVPWAPGGPQLPPMESGDGYQLHYTDAGGVLRGGYSCIGHVPQATTCLVRVYASSDVLDMMAADPAYLFVEDVDA
ncbi:MAG: hypothetical protein WC651_03175 [Candidatus Gracilibacteria bacterium]|jgi:hypothetical protein